MTSVRQNRVVVVDDSPDEEAFVRHALAASHPEAELHVYRSGEEAVAALTTGGDGRPALVLLDLKMRGLDGHIVLTRLRQHFRPGALPVVIFTSSREPSDVARAYAAGANSYVVKPTVFEDYLELVASTARYWLDLNVRED